MALRDQPYLPLYVQDFLTDEKLAECTASATGVYIRIMCLMHKSQEYGKILPKQNGWQIQDFAKKFARHFPYSYEEVLSGLHELLENDVLQITDGILCQKRMIKDNELSVSRSKSGSAGAYKTHHTGAKTSPKTEGFAKQFAKGFAMAKVVANTEYEYEDENENANGIVTDIEDGNDKGKKPVKLSKPSQVQLPDMEPGFEPIVIRWLEFKKQRKESYVSTESLGLFYKKLFRLSEGDPKQANAIIDQSLANNWAGIFELKENGRKDKSDSKGLDRSKQRDIILSEAEQAIANLNRANN